MKTLTVFTPTYNRSVTLERTYLSLCRQTCKDFCWLIVDDGSYDGTEKLVHQWQDEALIPIYYVFQENQGMHGAHNTAYRHIETELNVCIDSDDFMPDDAVEKIVNFWRENGSDSYAGIVGLDIYSDGSVIGSCFPKTIRETTLRGYYEDLRGRGDKKIVYRTNVIKSVPEYPLFEGERYVGLAYKYYLVDENYKLLVLNEPLVVVEYLEDGSSKGMWRQYWNNPKGFAFFRKFDMVQTHSFRRKVIDNIHYVSHSIRSRNHLFLKESPLLLLTLLSIIPGILLFIVNRIKVS